MAAKIQNPLARPDFPWVDQAGKPVSSMAQYFAQLDRAIRSFFGDSNVTTAAQIPVPMIGPLFNAANDAAAAAGGVPINGLYRNGSVVQIRVV